MGALPGAAAARGARGPGRVARGVPRHERAGAEPPEVPGLRDPEDGLLGGRQGGGAAGPLAGRGGVRADDLLDFLVDPAEDESQPRLLLPSFFIGLHASVHQSCLKADLAEFTPRGTTLQIANHSSIPPSPLLDMLSQRYQFQISGA